MNHHLPKENPYLEDEEIEPEMPVLPKIKKKTLAPPGYDPDTDTLFNSTTLESNISQFSIVSPGSGAGDSIMRAQNPSLLALSKRAKITKSSISHQPQKYSLQPGRMPIAHGITSLLSKKPLSDLPEPKPTLQEDAHKQVELEKISLEFDEDPIAYFSKRKDGRGHLFIYMKCARDKSDTLYSPYELIKVPYCEAGSEHYTMSASGVTYFGKDGDTEHYTLDQWAKQELIYKSIRKLKTFKEYVFWKPFRVWQNFVNLMRYNEIRKGLLVRPFFQDPMFTINVMQITKEKSKSERIIRENLIAFRNQKITIEQFVEFSISNIENLKSKYSDFMEKSATVIKQLYDEISDEKKLIVRDDDFDEIRSKNANLPKMMALENKKEQERIRRTEKMKQDLHQLADYLRMVDYILLESLRDSCYAAWNEAREIVDASQSAIFRIEIYFPEGSEQIDFKPSEEELTSKIKESLSLSTQTLESLPRILKLPILRCILKSSEYNLIRLFEDGSNLHILLNSCDLIDRTQKHIMEVIHQNYLDAHQNSLSFNTFYQLYKLGKEWNVRNYIKTKSGETFSDTLQMGERPEDEDEDFFLLNAENEPIVDFDLVTKDIEFLRTEQKRVKDIRKGLVRGTLHIDSNSIKNMLTPIPTNSLNDIEKALSELMQLKIDLMSRVFKVYTSKMKIEPTSIEIFVTFVELLQRTQSVIPQMTAEIVFVDKLVDLFDDSGFEPKKNPLHSTFSAFKDAQAKALTVQNQHNDKFTFVLKQLIKQNQAKLEKYRGKSVEIPKTMKGIDLDAFLKGTLKIKSKSAQIQPMIENLKRYQAVLNCKITEFTEFGELQDNIVYSEKLYQAVKQWDSLSQQVNTVPFAHVTMKEFGQDLNNLNELFNELNGLRKTPAPLCTEVRTEFDKVAPYVDQLTKLCYGRMQTRHWEQLFEECKQKGNYNIAITIMQLIDYGILLNTKSIEDITTTSQGESQLENEYKAIKDHWKDITLPLQDTPPGQTDQILLGTLDMLLADIKSTSITLNTMLQNPYISGIKTYVMNLSQTMENIVNILDEWQIFQGNWVILSSLFKQGAVKSILPHQATRFQVVERKWNSIVQHTLSDLKLFNVCSYPTMLEDFQENNSSLQIIFSSIGAFLDVKRESLPRLNFLSNDEVLALVSTTDFSVFTTHLVKMMMHITRFESHSVDGEGVTNESAREGCNFTGLKIFGVVGEDGDSLPFVNAVVCNGPIDYWIPQIFEMMNISTVDAVSISLARYASSSLNEWVMTVSTYVANLTLQIAFARDVEDCFNNLETNPRSFSMYENTMKRRVHDLMNTMSNPLSNSEISKVSTVLTILLNQYERIHAFQDETQFYSHKLAWDNTFKFKYDTNNADIKIVYNDKEWQHGHEYWGTSTNLVITPSVEQAMRNLINRDEPSLLFGPFASGKSELIRTFALYFGKFILIAPSFTSFSPVFLMKLISGAAHSGCLICFSDVHQLNHESMSFLFDAVCKLKDSMQSNVKELTINNVPFDIEPGFQVFMTCSVEGFGQLQPQLKSIIRPIALSIPQNKKIVETTLISSGFKAAKYISNKMEGIISTLVPIFEVSKTKTSHMLIIVRKAYFNLNQIIHNLDLSYIDYFSDSRTAEEFAIARAIYHHFIVLCDVSKSDLLLKVIFAYFKLFGDFDTFVRRIIEPDKFFIDRASVMIRNILTEKISTFKIELPIDYLIEQTIHLFEMILEYNCVIICGPSNSGKTLIVELLNMAFSVMVTDADLINHFPSIMPLRVDTIYHNKGTWADIFGQIITDEVAGYQWKYGIFQSAITHLEQYEKTHHRILRFDGSLTPKFNKFLYQFVCRKEIFKTNNLGTFLGNRTFHCIVETDDLSCLTPELLSTSGVLPMMNVQESVGRLEIRQTLLHPTLPFARAIQPYKDNFDEEQAAKLRSLFCEVAPTFVKKYQIDHSYQGCQLAIKYILKNNVDKDNEEQIKFVMAQSFYFIYLSSAEDTDEYEKFIINEFGLELPTQWDEDINEEYFAPSLYSTFLMNGEMTHLDIDLLDRVIIEGSHFDGDFTVPVSQYLPIYKLIETIQEPRSHIILHGPAACGKTSFLRFLFSVRKELTPIWFKITAASTMKQIISTIKTQTTLLCKTVNNEEQHKTYVLIFDDLTEENVDIVEFIRELATTNSICKNSPHDPKIFEYIKLNDFFIISVARDISAFPPRFLTHFTPVQMFDYSPKNIAIIPQRGMRSLGIDKSLCDLIYSVFEHFEFTLHEMVSIILIFAKIKVSMEDTLKVLIYELYFAKINDYEKIDELYDQLEEILGNSSYAQAFETVKQEKAFARTKQGVSSEVLTLDLKCVAGFLQTRMGSKVAYETYLNFVAIDHIISKPGSHCVIESETGASRVTLVKLVSIFQNITFHDFSHESNLAETMKKFVKENAKDDEQYHMIMFRQSESNTEEFHMISNVLSQALFSELFEPKELDLFLRSYLELGDEDDPIDEKQRYNAINKIQKHFRLHLHVVIIADVVDYDYPEFYDHYRLLSPTKVNICSNLLDESHKHLGVVLIQISEVIEEKLPLIHINQFYDFVNVFMSYITGDMKNSLSKTNQIKLTLDFISRLNLENEVFEAKLSSLTPVLEKLQIENDTMRDSYTQKHDAISMRRLKLNEEKMFRTSDVQKKLNEMKQAEYDLEALEPSVIAARDHVSQLTNADVEPIRINAENPGESVKLLLETIAILLGQNPSFEVTGHKLLMAPNLINIIAETIDFKTINSAQNEKLLSTLNDEMFSKKTLESIAPLLSTIRIYFEFLARYASLNEVYMEKKLNWEMQKRALNEFVEDMEHELDSIQDIEDTTKDDEKDMIRIASELKDTQNIYNDLTAQKETIDKILKDTEQLTNIWQNEIQKFSDLGDTMTGDSVLLAVYITYCGLFETDMRIEVLNAAIEQMKKSNLVTSFTDPLQDISNKIVTEGIPVPDDIMIPKVSLVDLHHLWLTSRYPLLIDPDGFMVHMIKGFGNFLMVSIHAKTFDEALKEAIDTNKNLLITDVDCLHARLTTIIQTKMKIKIILVSPLSDIDFIPIDLYSRVNVVNVSSSSLEAIKSSIMHTFLDHYAPTLMPRVVEVEKAENAHHMEVATHELETLETFTTIADSRRNKPDYSYLNDQETIEKLANAKEAFFNALHGSAEANSIKKELDDVITPFKPMISICHTLWVTISRYMSKVKPYYQFSFAQFKKIILGVFPKLQRGDDLKKMLVDAIFQWMQPVLSLEDFMFFLFLSAFMLKDLNWDDLVEIIQNIANQQDAKVNFINDSNVAVIDPIDSMKTAKLSEIFELITLFIRSYYGPDFDQKFQKFSIESVFPTSPLTPLCIFSDEEHDPTQEIIDYVFAKAKFDSFECITLRDSPDAIADAHSLIVQSMNKGCWLLLNYTQPSETAAELINEIHYLIAANPIHQSFRMILNLHCTDFVSNLIFSDSKKITIDPFPSPKLIMASLYSQFGAMLRTNTAKSKITKRLFYIGALAYSTLHFRSFIEPFSFNSWYGLDTTCFKDFIEYLTPFVESEEEDEDLPMRNLRDFCQDIAFGSRVIETHDRRSMRAILASFISPATLEDAFNFLDPESSEDMWLIPQEGPVSMFINKVNSFPTFPSTDVLMINKANAESLRNWNLSKWISQPFLSIFNTSANANDEEEEEEDGNEHPDMISEIDEQKPLSPISQFWLVEANKFNESLISKKNRDFTEPKSAFLKEMLSRDIPEVLELRFLADPKGFFDVYKTEMAMRLKMEADQLKLEFMPTTSASSNPNGIVLKGLYMFSGQIQNRVLVPYKTKQMKVFTEIPPILVSVSGKQARKGKYFVCPMFKNPFPEADDLNMFDGDIENYVTDVILDVSKGDRTWLLNSTAIYINIPDKFK